MGKMYMNATNNYLYSLSLTARSKPKKFLSERANDEKESI